MICETCAKTGDLNRKVFNREEINPPRASYPHPKNCGCACQHRKPTGWNKFFAVKEPNAEDS